MGGDFPAGLHPAHLPGPVVPSVPRRGLAHHARTQVGTSSVSKFVPAVDSPQVRRGERDDDATTPLHDPARLLRVLAPRARLDNAATAEATAATALMPRARLLPLPWRTSWPGRLALPRHPPGAAAWSKRPLGRAPARPLCLLRARLAALPLPRVLEPAASKAADVSAVDRAGALRGRRGQGAAAHGLHD